VTPECEALLHKSQRSIDSAKLMSEHGFYEFALSRAYYSMFYVAEALLLELRSGYRADRSRCPRTNCDRRRDSRICTHKVDIHRYMISIIGFERLHYKPVNAANLHVELLRI